MQFLAEHDAEPGCFYLTDYLARHFQTLVIEGLGIDRHPELLPLYFGNYTRLVYLAQSADPDLERRAKAAALAARARLRAARDGLRRPFRLPAAGELTRAMVELILVCWRDIPAQVIVKIGRRSAKRVLGDRFQEAIDRAAMRAGLRDTDAYLGEWRRTVVPASGEDLEAEADAAAARLEADYPPERLRALVANGGLEPVTDGSPA